MTAPFLTWIATPGGWRRRGSYLSTGMPAPQPPVTRAYSSFAQPGDTTLQALGRLTSDTVVDFEGQTKFVQGFTQGRGADGKSGYGIFNSNFIGWYNGELQMTPNTSTDYNTINNLVSGDTNNFELIRIGRGPTKATQAYFQGKLTSTPQGSNYNGIIFYWCNNSVMENSTVLGFQGSSGAPPGETFPVDVYHSDNFIMRWCTIDGQGVAASGLGNNYNSGLIVQNSTFKNMGYGAGVTHYLSVSPTYENCVFSNNHNYGANFEKVSGTITLRNCTFSANISADICVDTDGPSAIVNIYDPIWDGMTTGKKFRIKRHNTYNYPPPSTSPNQQNISDFHIFQGGVETTSSVLQIVT